MKSYTQCCVMLQLSCLYRKIGLGSDQVSLISFLVANLDYHQWSIIHHHHQ